MNAMVKRSLAKGDKIIICGKEYRGRNPVLLMSGSMTKGIPFVRVDKHIKQ